MKKKRIVHCVSAAVAALFACAPALADTYTWNNSATGTNSWSLATNWINNARPVSGNVADVLFSDSPRFAPVQDISNPFTLRSIWFYDKSWTLSGNQLVFDGTDAAIFNYTTTSISNQITLNSTTRYEGTGNATFTNTLTGPGGFIKNGSGTVTFQTFNLYNGDTAINAGQVLFGHYQALLFTTAILNTNNGINFNGFAADVGNIAGAGNLNLGSSAIIVGRNNTSKTYSGQFSGTGSIDKQGAGTWTLGGAGSTFSRFSVSSGRTVLSGGSLTLTSSDPTNRALTLGSSLDVGNLDVFAGAVLNTLGGSQGSALIKGVNAVTTSMLSVTGTASRWDASLIDIGGTSSGTPGVVVADSAGVINATYISVGKPASGSLIVQNSGIVNATHLNVSSIATDPVPTVAIRSGGQANITETILTTPTSSIDVNSATLHTAMLTSASGNGSINLRDPSGASALVIDGSSASATYAGSISGSGGITKNGASTQTLSGQNTYSGATTVNGGNLILTNGASSAYNANGTGQITLNFGNLGSSSLRVAAGGTIHYPPNVIGGFIRGSSGNHDITNVTSFNGTTFAVDSVLTVNNPLALNNVTNSGNLTNNSSLTWDGGLNTSAGIININAKTSVSSFENDGVINIQRGGLLTNSNTNLVSGGGSRIIIDPQGQMDLASSELHLNGSLLVNNGVIRGRTNVNFGALAKGAGEYGEVNVTDGGRFSPGNSPGTVTTGSTTWNSGGSYLVELDNAAGDFWNVDGQLKIDASPQHPFTISLASLDGLIFDNSRDYLWPILHAAGGIVDLDPAELAIDTFNFKNDPGAGHFFLSASATDLNVNFSAVPEPAALSALAVALCAAVRRRRIK